MAYGVISGQSLEGSPVLNNYFTKEETLSSDTAALYGLNANSAPDAVFNKIKTLVDDISNTSTELIYGSYVGDAEWPERSSISYPEARRNSQTIVLGFEPKLVIIITQVATQHNPSLLGGSTVAILPNAPLQSTETASFGPTDKSPLPIAEIQSNGFLVSNSAVVNNSSITEFYPALNMSGQTYIYLAIK